MTSTDPLLESHPTHDKLISHGAAHEDDALLLQRVRSRLQAAGEAPGATVQQVLSLAEELASFDLGRFLLRHRGLNADWTHQLVTYQPGSIPADDRRRLEHQMFEQLPATLATRERFGIFRRELRSLMKPGITAASVPCGLMGELLLLDDSALTDVSLVGIDLDAAALEGAHTLAEARGLTARVSLRCQDAWSLDMPDSIDVLTSNGLNIYEPDDGRVVMLYQSFLQALRPGGTLVTSFLTPPPVVSSASPWKMDAIDPEMLALQTLLFVRVIEAKWQAFRTHAQTMDQLQRAGFTHIRFIDDRARMFPTVVAQKPA